MSRACIILAAGILLAIPPRAGGGASHCHRPSSCRRPIRFPSRASARPSATWPESPSRATPSAPALARLWGLGLFSAIRVEEVPEPGGVRLRYVLAARPLIRHITWEGESGLDIADVAAVAALAIGEEASPARLAQAERDMLTRYHREGYLAARVILTTRPVPGSAERDVTVFLNAGDQARVGTVPSRATRGCRAEQIEKALKLGADDPYRESLARDGARAAEERLRQEGYYGARVTRPRPTGARRTTAWTSSSA